MYKRNQHTHSPLASKLRLWSQSWECSNSTNGTAHRRSVQRKDKALSTARRADIYPYVAHVPLECQRAARMWTQIADALLSSDTWVSVGHLYRIYIDNCGLCLFVISLQLCDRLDVSIATPMASSPMSSSIRFAFNICLILLLPRRLQSYWMRWVQLKLAIVALPLSISLYLSFFLYSADSAILLESINLLSLSQSSHRFYAHCSEIILRVFSASLNEIIYICTYI